MLAKFWPGTGPPSIVTVTVFWVGVDGALELPLEDDEPPHPTIVATRTHAP
jgi:hypothetical protein